MSRNEGRTDVFNETQLDADPTAQITHQNPEPTAPAMAWSVPTDFVNLPSKGIFYPPGHPLHNQETVEIRYMTAKEEDILTSRALLKEGIALDRMLQNILVDKSINLDTLLVGDKSALVVAARVTGYGPEYATNMTCPACGNTDEFVFDVGNPECNDFQAGVNDFEVEITANNTFLIQLPMTKATVECRLLTAADEKHLMKQIERKNKRKEASGITTEQFKAFIVSVNGDDSPITTISFINAMPARDARSLRTVYRAIVPNIDLTQDYNCENCGYEAALEVPLDSTFFWPK